MQACGVSFTVSTVALAAILAHDGALETSIAGASLLALVPALIGMAVGQWVRSRVRPDVFRVCFLAGTAAAGRSSRPARRAVTQADEWRAGAVTNCKAYLRFGRRT